MITDPKALKGRRLEEVVQKALLGGASVIQLRDKELSDAEMIKVATTLLAITKKYQVPLIINDRPEVAKASGADGLHLGQDDGSLEAARQIVGADMIVGRSTHSTEQALAAEKEGFDYIGVGPVFSTPTKPDYEPVGLELVRFASQSLKIPFVAIGGIDESNILQVKKHGARCVAVVRAVMGSENPDKAAQALLQKMKGEG